MRTHSLACLLGSWALLVCAGSARADATIDVDGDLGDWPADAFTFLDNNGDFPPPWSDIEQVWVTDDNDEDDDGNLYVAIDFTSRFRDHIGSNDIDIFVNLDVDGDGVIGGPDDRIIELTSGVVTDGDGNVVGAIDEMDYSDDVMEAAIPYSVLGLEFGADTFGISFIAAGKPGGEVDSTPNEGDSSVPYDGTQSPEPLAVRLAALAVRAERDGNRVMWSTGAERSNVGFHVFKRGPWGRWIRLTRAPLPGLFHALLGRSYAYFDPDGRPGDAYKIEDISLAGVPTAHGPVLAQARVPAPPSVRARTPRRKTASFAPRSAPRVMQPKGRTASIKLKTNEAGPLLLTDEFLASTGLEFGRPGQTPLITRQGQPVPTLQRPGGYLLIGRPLIDRHADHEVLLVTAGQGAPAMPTAAVSDCSSAAENVVTSLRQADDRTYLVASLGLDPFFWAAVFQGFPAQLTLKVPAPEAKAAKLRVELVGLAVLHRVEVWLNGAWLGEAHWQGRHPTELIFDVPDQTLLGGENQIEVRLPADAGYDAVFVEAIGLDYSRRLLAPEGRLSFTAQPGTCMQISGLPGQRPILLDVTDLSQPMALEGCSLRPNEDGTTTLRFVDRRPLAQRSYLLLDETAVLPTPEVLGPPSDRRFDGPDQGADVLIISHPEFAHAAGRLVAMHQQRGLSSLVATTEEAYDAFAGGRKSPDAIRALIHTALDSWKRRPRFVLLLGAASVDPHGHLPDSRTDFLPSPFVVTTRYGYEAASDAWYAAGDDGLIPRIAVGRLAVRSAQEAEAIVDKLFAAGRSDRGRRALLVTDDRDPSTGPTHKYELAAEQLADSCLPPSVRVSHLAKAASHDPVGDLEASIAANPDVLTYHGHAFLTAWSSAPSLLTSIQAANLDNSHPFALFSFTCFDGAHTGPWGNSLAWELVANPNGGASLAFAATSLSDPDAVSLVGQQLVCRLASGQAATVGQAMVDVARDLAGLDPEIDDVLRTYTLLGDPTWPSPFGQ